MNFGNGNPNIARAMAQIQARRDGADVKHVCPECGGQFAEHLGALAVVQTCWACGGSGVLTSDELTAYEARSRVQSSGLDIT